ncbi:MAG TPA: DUF2442 domain-containing protein [Vicinamibacterales bacterium]|nr:DUF2442 domain-containing protein [Vicinamibacterales bacterium]
MAHPIHRVTSFRTVAPYTLLVSFADGTEQRIDFKPVLKGELFGPLLDSDIFSRVVVDQEAGTLVWPNGADFDPATLHDWPALRDDLIALADTWVNAPLTKARAR